MSEVGCEELVEIVIEHQDDLSKILRASSLYLPALDLIYPFMGVCTLWKEAGEQELVSRLDYEQHIFLTDFFKLCERRDLRFFIRTMVYLKETFPTSVCTEQVSLDEVWSHHVEISKDSKAVLKVNKSHQIEFSFSFRSEGYMLDVTYDEDQRDKYVEGRQLISQSSTPTPTSRQERVTLKAAADVKNNVNVIDKQDHILCASIDQEISCHPFLKMLLNNNNIFCVFGAKGIPGSEYSWYQYNANTFMNYTIFKSAQEQLKYMNDDLFLDRYLNRCLDELKCLTRAAILRLPIFVNNGSNLLPMLQRKDVVNKLIFQIEEMRSKISQNINQDRSKAVFIVKYLHENSLLQYLKTIVLPHWASANCAEQQVYLQEQTRDPAYEYGNCDDAEFIKRKFDSRDLQSNKYQEDDSTCCIM
ncbi:hypothetical protein AKO1_002936 [Acrasis kona]|uniref:Uncharacterized protein n=1 Tax=Acrasis kona TaxID=1008807 RepID=A0AAW2Z845_9EUKA